MIFKGKNISYIFGKLTWLKININNIMNKKNNFKINKINLD
jgi:hypothetical protein